MCLATIVLSLAATTVRAGEVLPATPADSNVVVARLSFPDTGESMASAMPIREDRVADSTVPQQALVPLPTGGSMGVISLACLTLVGSRKAIIRFIT
jgi:hypothetical protein